MPRRVDVYQAILRRTKFLEERITADRRELEEKRGELGARTDEQATDRPCSGV
jgi:hypothetical protein